MTERSLTLRELLGLIRQSEDNPEILDEINLGELTRDKVEAYHDVIQMLNDDSERLKQRAKHFKDLAEMQARKAERVEERLRFAMRESGSDRLPGYDFNAVLGRRKTLKITQAAIGPDEFTAWPDFITPRYKWARDPSITDRAAMPDLVETTYQWDKDALRQAFKAGTAPDDLRPFANYDEQETFTWQVRKEV